MKLKKIIFAKGFNPRITAFYFRCRCTCRTDEQQTPFRGVFKFLLLFRPHQRKNNAGNVTSGKKNSIILLIKIICRSREVSKIERFVRALSKLMVCTHIYDLYQHSFVNLFCSSRRWKHSCTHLYIVLCNGKVHTVIFCKADINHLVSTDPWGWWILSWGKEMIIYSCDIHWLSLVATCWYYLKVYIV